MAFDFNKYNTLHSNSIIRAGFDSKNNEFKPLKDFVGKTIPVNGFFFTTGRYGEQVVVVADGVNVNMPKRCAEDFKLIASDNEAVQDILAGNVIITDIAMKDTTNGRTVIYNFGKR